jgi:hypothetical protein
VLTALQQIARGVFVIANQQTLRPGFSVSVVTVQATPTLVFVDSSDRSILISNPASPAVTTFGTILASAVRGGTGNTTASPLSVANYNTLRLFLNITVSSGGTIRIDSLTRDPVSLAWAGLVATHPVQSDLFGLPSAVGAYYANINQIGVDIAYAVQYTVSAGTPTWSLSFVAKDGLPGASTGADRTIYIGPPGVSTSFGFPLREGAERSFFVRANTPLYAVASSAVPINVARL